MASNRSFWVLQALLIPVRLALAACAITAIVFAIGISVDLSSGVASPLWPLIVALMLGILVLATVFGGAILFGLVWVVGGMLALRRGDLTRLDILRRAEFYLAIVLTVLLVSWHRQGELSVWTIVLVFFASVQWAAWYLLHVWERPKTWLAVGP